MYMANNDPHASTHGNIGGQMGCEMLDELSEMIISDINQVSLNLPSIYISLSYYYFYLNSDIYMQQMGFLYERIISWRVRI